MRKLRESMLAKFAAWVICIASAMGCAVLGICVLAGMMDDSLRSSTRSEILKDAYESVNIDYSMDVINHLDFDKNNYGEYILIYALVPDERLTKVANKMAKERNIKLIELNDKKIQNYFCEQVSEAGPSEFLTLIKNAKAVITNSYHGTIFSIIFQKEFYTINRKSNNNSRMENILKIVDMEDRLISEIEEIQNIGVQDYKKAFDRLKKEKENSIKFLKEALK